MNSLSPEISFLLHSYLLVFASQDPQGYGASVGWTHSTSLPCDWNSRLYLVILARSASWGWLNVDVGQKEHKAPQPIPCHEEQQLETRLADMSNLVYKPLSALWLRPVHRYAYPWRYARKPRQAKKSNRNKKVFTAIGWLILFSAVGLPLGLFLIGLALPRMSYNMKGRKAYALWGCSRKEASPKKCLFA